MLLAVELASTKRRSLTTDPLAAALVVNASGAPEGSESIFDSVAALPTRTVPAAGGGGVVFAVVTVTDVAVAVLPAASRATAVSVCDPFATVVESQLIEYGAAVSSTPRLAPS